jgi:rhamnose transport system substrate-binding protein
MMVGRIRVRNLAVVSVVLALVATVAVAVGASSATPQVKNAASEPTIEYIEQNTGNPYFDEITIGFKEEAAKLGYKLLVTGPADAGASSQIPFIEQAIVKHIDAIGIQPNDPLAPLPALRQAKAAGIKLVSVNIDSIPSVRVAAVTGANYNLCAPEQLADVAAEMHYSGELAILSATTTAPFQKMVVGQMESLLKTDPKYKNIDLVKVAYGQDIASVDTAQTDALLTEYPNLKAISSPTTIGLTAAAQAIVAAGKKGKIILDGLGDPNEMRKYLANGTLKDFQLWDPVDEGIVSGYILYESLKGTTVKRGGKITVPGYGTLVVSSDGSVYAQNTLTTFTKANVGQFNF